MTASASQATELAAGRAASGRAPCRPRLARRRRQARAAARERNAAHVTRPLTSAQRARVLPRRRSAAARALAAVAAVGGSALVHGGIVGLGLVAAALSFGVERAEEGPVVFAVKEPEASEPEPPPPEPEPEPEAPRAAAVEQAVAPEPAPAEAPPPEALEAKPLRVVGLSLEATVEGGGGPAFAVGQTRMGETARRAADPERKTEPTADIAEPTAPAPTTAIGANRVASRIPTAKVSYQMPKRKRPRLPAYPATLKSQGVEADVTVMVSLDASGKVTDVKIISPAPNAEFNEAARAAALAEEFEPALRDGVPVAYTLSYTYRFRIEER